MREEDQMHRVPAEGTCQQPVSARPPCPSLPAAGCCRPDCAPCGTLSLCSQARRLLVRCCWGCQARCPAALPPSRSCNFRPFRFDFGLVHSGEAEVMKQFNVQKVSTGCLFYTSNCLFWVLSGGGRW